MVRGHACYEGQRRGQRATCGRKVGHTWTVVGGIDPPQTEVVFTLIGRRHARFLLEITLEENSKDYNNPSVFSRLETSVTKTSATY